MMATNGDSDSIDEALKLLNKGDNLRRKFVIQVTDSEYDESPTDEYDYSGTDDYSATDE